MCFTKQRKRDKAIKATKNIVVYKALIGDPYLKSPYYTSCYWTKGERVEEQRFVKENIYKRYLDYGFHSCKSIRGAKQHAQTVYEFVIPRGALYYENRSEYLSNKIYLKSVVPIKFKK